MSHGACRTSEDAVRVRLAGGWQELQWWQNVADVVILLIIYNVIINIQYGCVFFKRVQILVKAGCSSSANHTPESYPESYPRIIPPIHTPDSYLRIVPPKITIMNVSFGIVWDCIGLTSFNGPDKLIDRCWPDPMIPGYLHIPSRHEW